MFAVKEPEQLQVIRAFRCSVLYESTWPTTTSPLYCVNESVEFTEISAATAIPKRFSKEMQYA